MFKDVGSNKAISADTFINHFFKPLPNYRLQTIERVRYDHKREGDIHGSEIAGAYQDFLSTANPANMKRIIDHNALDLATMGAMFYDVHKSLHR